MSRTRRIFLVMAALTTATAGLTVPGPATAATPLPVKPVLSGLLDRKGTPAASHETALRGFVADVRWSDVQPAPTAFDTASLDATIATARAKGYRVKLRLRAGADSPAWVKASAGSMSMYTTDTADTGRALTVPRWWTPEFRAAFDALHAKVAARYDANPAVGQVTLCGPSVHYCEPHLRSIADVRNRQTLLRAGYTAAADQAAHRANIQAGRHWKRTALEVAFNPHQTVQPDATVTTDVAFTIDQMRRFRAAYGSRAVLANNSVRSSFIGMGGPYGAMYAEQKRLGRPLSYQTATVKKIGDWRATLRWAAEQGASSVELPSGYVSWPAAELRTLGNTAAANSR